MYPGDEQAGANTRTCMKSPRDTYSKYKTRETWSHKPSVKATLIIFPPPSPSLKPRGFSHPRPLLCAHLLCRTGRLAGEARRGAGSGGPGDRGALWLWKGSGWEVGLDASEQRTGFHGDTVLQCLQPPNSVSDLSSPSLYSSQAHCVPPLLM